MAGAIERRTTGPFGAFPLRLPLGKLAACFVAAALIPIWWTVGLSQTPYLKTFYERTYWASLRDSYRLTSDGKLLPAEYALLLEQTEKGLSLASVEDAEASGNRLRVERRFVNPKLFHAWLRDEIYHGSALNTLRLLCNGRDNILPSTVPCRSQHRSSSSVVCDGWHASTRHTLCVVEAFQFV